MGDLRGFALQREGSPEIACLGTNENFLSNFQRKISLTSTITLGLDLSVNLCHSVAIDKKANLIKGIPETRQEQISDSLSSEYGVHASNLELVQNSYVNDVYRFLCDNTPYAFRITKQDKSKLDACFEIEIHSFLRGKNFPVPAITNNPNGVSPSFLVQEWTNGEKPLGDVHHKPSLTPCKNAGKTLGELHTITAEFSPAALPSRNIEDELTKLVSLEKEITSFSDGGEEPCHG